MRWDSSVILDLPTADYKPQLKSCLVVNRKIGNTAISRDVREALAELEVRVLKTDIAQRVAFAESAASGSTVIDHKKSKAAEEIKNFVNELKRITLHDKSRLGSQQILRSQTSTSSQGVCQNNMSKKVKLTSRPAEHPNLDHWLSRIRDSGNDPKM